MTEIVEKTELLPRLPDEARVWIYAADRHLGPVEQERLTSILNSFCAVWKSHGRPVESASAVLAGRFAVIAGRIVDGDISGCGIDASVHALDTAAQELGLTWLPSLSVLYRDPSGQIQSVPRPQFREKVRSGEVDSATMVFDLTLETLGELRSGGFERPAGESWHARIFGIRS